MEPVVYNTKAILEEHHDKVKKVKELEDALYALHPVIEVEYPYTYWENDPRPAIQVVLSLYKNALKDLAEFEEIDWLMT